MSLKAIEKIIETSNVSENELIELLLSDNSSDLFLKAAATTEQLFGKEVHIRGIIEFSNYCRCSCHYCGINALNKNLTRYRFSPKEILKIAEEAIAAGYKTIILQSGEDPFYDTDKVSHIIREIKKLGDISLTLSIGEYSYEAYRQWKKDGADRYLLKHETSDEKLYNQYHPHSSFDKKMECLHNLKSLGYETGSGFMVGLPGQTVQSLAQDILLLKKLDVEMAGIGVFIPHPETPLANHLSGNNLMALKCVAVTRLLLKRVHLPATTSVNVNNNRATFNPFSAGANVVMKKLEPYKYQKLYEIYPNTLINNRSILENREELESSICSFGRIVSESKGSTVSRGSGE